MDIIFIFAMSCIFTSASGQWFWGGLGSGSTSKPLKRDCIWMQYGAYGSCKDIKGTFMKKRERGQVKALGGGAPCVGPDHEYASCTSAEIRGSTFMATVGAALTSGGGGSTSSRRTLNNKFQPPKAAQKCINKDVTDANGNILMSGKKCSQSARKRREASAYTEFAASRTKRQAPPVFSTNNRDVLFLLDESGSVGSNNFKTRVVRLAKAVAGSFCGAISIGQTTTRVGVMNFDRSQYAEIDFDKYFSKAHLLAGMDSDIDYHKPTSGATCLIDALNFARTDMFQAARGARIGVAGTERIAILVTDGCANCKKTTQLKSHLETIGQQFTAQGIPIITFLVTGNPGYCFDIMKGLSDGSQCYQQFHASSWTDFDNIIQSIENAPCMDAWYIGPSC